jgi:hypothetical protein
MQQLRQPTFILSSSFSHSTAMCPSPHTYPSHKVTPPLQMSYPPTHSHTQLLTHHPVEHPTLKHNNTSSHTVTPPHMPNHTPSHNVTPSSCPPASRTAPC